MTTYEEFVEATKGRWNPFIDREEWDAFEPVREVIEYDTDEAFFAALREGQSA